MLLKPLYELKASELSTYGIEFTDTEHSLYLSKKIYSKSGKPRHLEIPSGELKKIQKHLLGELEKRFQLHPAATGVKGNSYIRNAEHHRNNSEILRVDLSNFYRSVSSNKLLKVVNDYYPVQSLWFSNYWAGMFISVPGSVQIRPNLTNNLVTSDRTNQQGLPLLYITSNYLPTGASTSPYLSNIALYPVDLEVQAIADQYHGIYTRYIDDLTLSFKDTLDSATKNKIAVSIKSIIEKYQYRVKLTKSKWLDPVRDRITVTGVDLRTGIQVNNSYIRETVKPIIERDIRNLVINDWSRPEYLPKQLSSKYCSFESLIPVYLPKTHHYLGYVKQVNINQYNKLVIHIQKRLERALDLSNLSYLNLSNHLCNKLLLPSELWPTGVSSLLDALQLPILVYLDTIKNR